MTLQYWAEAVETVLDRRHASTDYEVGYDCFSFYITDKRSGEIAFYVDREGGMQSSEYITELFLGITYTAKWMEKIRDAIRDSPFFYLRITGEPLSESYLFDGEDDFGRPALHFNKQPYATQFDEKTFKQLPSIIRQMVADGYLEKVNV